MNQNDTRYETLLTILINATGKAFHGDDVRDIIDTIALYNDREFSAERVNSAGVLCAIYIMDALGVPVDLKSPLLVGAEEEIKNFTEASRTLVDRMLSKIDQDIMTIPLNGKKYDA